MLKMYPFCHWRYLSLDGDRPMRVASSMYTQRIRSRLFAVADVRDRQTETDVRQNHRLMPVRRAY